MLIGIHSLVGTPLWWVHLLGLLTVHESACIDCRCRQWLRTTLAWPLLWLWVRWLDITRCKCRRYFNISSCIDVENIACWFLSSDRKCGRVNVAGMNIFGVSDRLGQLLLLTTFPVLTGLDLYAIYKELQSVHLQTLNKVMKIRAWCFGGATSSRLRLKLIEALWVASRGEIQCGFFPSPTLLPITSKSTWWTVLVLEMAFWGLASCEDVYWGFEMWIFGSKSCCRPDFRL